MRGCARLPSDGFCGPGGQPTDAKPLVQLRRVQVLDIVSQELFAEQEIPDGARPRGRYEREGVKVHGKGDSFEVDVALPLEKATANQRVVVSVTVEVEGRQVSLRTEPKAIVGLQSKS